MKRYDQAIRCYDKAIELDPEHAGSWNNKGICHRKKGQLEEALVCHGTALTLDPRDVGGWYNKALVQEQLECIQDAKSSYEKYLTVADIGIDTDSKMPWRDCEI